MKNVLYVILFLAIVAGGLYMYFVAGNQMRSWRGEQTGTNYIAKLYGDHTVMGSSCQGQDSDGDGYITCNFRIKSPQNTERTIILQCPTFWKSYMGNSCKENGLMINTQ